MKSAELYVLDCPEDGDFRTVITEKILVRSDFLRHDRIGLILRLVDVAVGVMFFTTH
jgi:hypothetical protein